LYVNDAEKTIKRFTVTEEDSLESFLLKLTDAGIDATKYKWQYKDEEGDVVTFSTAKEFEVIRSMKSADNVLRVFFEPLVPAEPKKENNVTVDVRKRRVIALLLPLLAAATAYLILVTAFDWSDHSFHHERVHRVQTQTNTKCPHAEKRNWVQDQARRDMHEYYARMNARAEKEARLRVEAMNRERILQAQREQLAEVQRQQERERLILAQREREREFREQIQRQARIQEQEQMRERILRAQQVEKEREEARLKEQQIREKKVKELREQRIREEKEQHDREWVKSQHEYLKRLGYDNWALNDALLRVHLGDIRLVVEALQNFR
jgi:flagellar biosynthesis GTPase FlhF